VSEVTRVSGYCLAVLDHPPTATWVLGSDYDAAQAEIARLTREREEWRAQVFRMTETITEWRHKSERLRAALDIAKEWIEGCAPDSGAKQCLREIEQALRGAGETKEPRCSSIELASGVRCERPAGHKASHQANLDKDHSVCW
jgi:hypothetical protein